MSSAARTMKRRMARQGYAHSYANLSREERKEQLFKNGITDADIDKAYHEGFRSGFNDRTEQIFKLLYAAVILEMHERGCERAEILSFLRAVDNRIAYSLSAEEDVENAYNETGIDFTFALDSPDQSFTERKDA